MSEDFFQFKNFFELNSKIISNLVIGISERKQRRYTIAIPTYKRPELLEKSLVSAINQSDKLDYEIIEKSYIEGAYTWKIIQNK